MSDTQGGNNTAIGDGALLTNIAGNANTAIGLSAGHSITGDGDICIGASVYGVAGESSTTRIGSNRTTIYIAGIAGQTVGNGGSTCYADNDGKVGVFLSAHRFKTDIADMAAASEGLIEQHRVHRFVAHRPDSSAIWFSTSWRDYCEARR